MNSGFVFEYSVMTTNQYSLLVIYIRTYVCISYLYGMYVHTYIRHTYVIMKLLSCYDVQTVKWNIGNGGIALRNHSFVFSVM